MAVERWYDDEAKYNDDKAFSALYGEGAMGDTCLAESGHENLCGREKGHGGPHESYGMVRGRAVERWYDDNNETWDGCVNYAEEKLMLCKRCHLERFGWGCNTFRELNDFEPREDILDNNIVMKTPKIPTEKQLKKEMAKLKREMKKQLMKLEPVEKKTGRLVED